MTRRRPATGAYPIWIGLSALSIIGLVWMTGEPSPPTDSTPDATVVEAPQPDAAHSAPRLRTLEWRIDGATQPTAADLEACLQEEGLPQSSVAGTGPSGLTVHHRTAPRIQSVQRIDGGLVVRTPVDEDANKTARRHVLVTLCLYGENAAIIDEVHGRRAGVDWPQLGPSGGLPIETVVTLRQQGNTWVTHGLAPLGRRELGVWFPSGREDTAKLVIRKAAATSLAGPPGNTRLQWNDGRARLVSSASGKNAGWWTGPTDPTLWLLAQYTGPSRALELPAKAARLRPTIERPPPRKPRRRPRTPKKAFWPDYR